MSLNILSSAIHGANIPLNLMCNRILKLSNRQKPEALFSSLDLLFHDMADYNSLCMTVMNIFCVATIFLDKVHPILDFSASIFVNFLTYQFTMSFTAIFVITLLEIYEKSYLLEDFTDDDVCLAVRVSTALTTLAVFGGMALLGTYPYLSMVHPDQLLQPSNSTTALDWDPVSPMENPFTYVLAVTNSLMLTVIFKKKLDKTELK